MKIKNVFFTKSNKKIIKKIKKHIDWTQVNISRVFPQIIGGEMNCEYISMEMDKFNDDCSVLFFDFVNNENNKIPIVEIIYDEYENPETKIYYHVISNKDFINIVKDYEMMLEYEKRITNKFKKMIVEQEERM